MTVSEQLPEVWEYLTKGRGASLPGHAKDQIIALAEEVSRHSPTYAAGWEAGRRAAEVGPNLGARTNEPGLRFIIKQYYMEHLTPAKAQEMADSYLAALTAPVGEGEPIAVTDAVMRMEPCPTCRSLRPVPAAVMLGTSTQTQWRPIETAPTGLPSEDVGCRNASAWFEARVSPKYRRGRPEYIVVQRRAWPQEDSWECAGEAYYVPDFFDAWRPLRPAPQEGK